MLIADYMEQIIKSEGTVGPAGHILASNLPFKEGEKVEFVVWRSEIKNSQCKIGGGWIGWIDQRILNGLR